jgi:hypothetical protein
VVVDDPDLIQDLQEEDLRDLMNVDGDDDDNQSVISISTSVISEIFNTALGTPEHEHPTADDRFDEIDRVPPGVFDDDMYDDYDIDEDEFDECDEDGGNVDFELYDDENDEIHDYDVYEGDIRDEYEEEEYYEDEEDDDGDDDDMDDIDGPMYPDRRSADTEFGGVEMIYPRRMFRGAKNVETVKDCTSLRLLCISTDK